MIKSNYIRQYIIRQAKNKLAVGTGIAQVAYSLGFDYSQHLSRMFKKQTGIIVALPWENSVFLPTTPRSPPCKVPCHRILNDENFLQDFDIVFTSLDFLSLTHIFPTMVLTGAGVPGA